MLHMLCWVLFLIIWIVLMIAEYDCRSFILNYNSSCTVSSYDLNYLIETEIMSDFFHFAQSTPAAAKNITSEVLSQLIIQKSSLYTFQRLEQLSKKKYIMNSTLPAVRKLKSFEVSSRDILIAALDIIAWLRKNQNFSFEKNEVQEELKNKPLLQVEHLAHLEMDIIEDSADLQLFELAQKLPCVPFPPELDKEFSFEFNENLRSTYLPNDFLLSECGAQKTTTAMQWSFMGPDSNICPEKYGVGITEAWPMVYQSYENRPVIAVVDSGCSFSPDLSDNVCSYDEPCAGYNFGDDTPGIWTTSRDEQHGTMTTSLIAAQGNNMFGIAGICWNCRIMCIKISKTGYSTVRDAKILQALDHLYGATLAGILKVSNHSYSRKGFSFAIQNALRRLRDVGHLIIAAAGNNGCDIDSQLENGLIGCSKIEHYGPTVLGNYDTDNLLVVGSISRNGNISWFSNYGGKHVHLFAPGESIVTLESPCSNFLNDGLYLIQGTSFSAPLVAGVVGLMLQVNPSANYHEIKEAIINSARKHSNFKGKSVSGGVLYAPGALELISSTVTNNIQPPMYFFPFHAMLHSLFLCVHGHYS